jgi:HK97 gp10 family phage protein
MARRSGLRGINLTRRRLRRLPEETRSGIKSALAAGAGLMLDTAKQLVPKDTGNLESLLAMRIQRDGLSARVGLIGKRANRKGYYGRYLEDGTVNIPAQPFLTPAFMAHKADTIKAVSDAIAEALTKVFSRGS